MTFIRQKIKAIPFLGSAARVFHYALTGGWRRDATLLISRDITDDHAFVLQIGSNDGASGDPIFKLMRKHPLWEGLFVEPVPYLFQRLKNNYGSSPRFRFENAAVNDGSREIFYWVDPRAKKEFPGLPEWWEQLGSFRKGYIEKVLGPPIRGYVRETPIRGLTLAALLQKYRIARLDVVHIDVEGRDGELVAQLGRIGFKPRVVLFEHKHLSPADKRAALESLGEEYATRDLGDDYYCRRE